MSPSWQEAQWGNSVTEGVAWHSLASVLIITHTQTHIDSFPLLMKLFYKNCTCAESVMRLPWRGRIRRRDGKRGSWKKKKLNMYWFALSRWWFRMYVRSTFESCEDHIGRLEIHKYTFINQIGKNMLLVFVGEGRTLACGNKSCSKVNRQHNCWRLLLLFLWYSNK